MDRKPAGAIPCISEVMMKKYWLFPLAALLGGCGATAIGDQDLNSHSPTRDLRQEVSYLEHEQENTQVQISMFEQKLEAQDNLIAELRSHMLQGRQESMRSSVERLGQLNKDLEDLQQIVESHGNALNELKSHSTNLASSLAQYFEKIKEFDKNMRKFEGALESLIGINERATATSGALGAREYMVKSGDTLEKIAKRHKVTIADLKRANGLTGDRIYPEQKLSIPVQ